MENLFGTKISLYAKQVEYFNARQLIIWIFPYLSNVERGERKARREWIPKLAQLLKANEDELLTAWLADRIQELVQDEKVTKDNIKAVAIKMGMKVK